MSAGTGCGRRRAASASPRPGLSRSEPLSKLTLRKGLERSTELVRRYAAMLIEEGARADTAAARSLGCHVDEITPAREALDALLDGIVEA